MRLAIRCDESLASGSKPHYGFRLTVLPPLRLRLWYFDTRFGGKLETAVSDVNIVQGYQKDDVGSTRGCCWPCYFFNFNGAPSTGKVTRWSYGWKTFIVDAMITCGSEGMALRVLSSEAGQVHALESVRRSWCDGTQKNHISRSRCFLCLVLM